MSVMGYTKGNEVNASTATSGLICKGGFKRPKTSKGSDTSKHARKNRRTKDEIARSPSPSTSGDSSDSEEPSTVASEEEVVYKEPSMYDNLLKTLGSGSESLANAYKRRQREEEGKSDTEEDADSVSESLSMSEEEDDGEEGTGSESPRSHAMGSNLQGYGLVGVMEQNEDAGTDDDDEASDTDEEHDLKANGQTITEALVSTSSFNDHLGYKISKGEVDNLSKKKWKYKWEVPAVEMSNCKWIGTGECFIKDVDMNSGYGLKLKLYKHWLDIYEASGGKDFHSSKQRLFFSLCNSYWDILHQNKKPFYLKGLAEDSSIMDAYIMHSLNHIFRTRDLVTKNDAKVAKHQESAKEEILNDDGFLDHGFTRPKVLFLLPLASIALRVVKRLIQLTPSTHKVNVEHIDRFSDEFGTGVAEDNEGRNEASYDFHDFEHSKAQKSSKPSDFQALFGGNNNDHFMIGIKFTRRSIKLYSDFYSSDMIVASPLGLMTKIGEAEVEKEKDVDYLSSIEVLIIDHADVIAMQNWSHVNSVVEQLNRIPSKQHGTDIMRIRQWCLDGHAQFYRQTIILGSYLNPDINALFNHHCVNYQGKVKSVCENKGVLPKVLLQVRQIYERFDAESIVDEDDARLEYFAKKVFPKIKDSIQGGIMLFISSYFEFVRVRNFLKSQDASFCLLGEYTKQSDISRARVWFFQGRRKIMLYTERAHFYHRYKIRGIQNLIIYSLPERKEFYPEIVNMLEGSHGMTCTMLFSRFDQLRLERIVGTAPAKRMVTSDKGVFVFC
uniref:Putative U3 small nucleolar RNA-associated protein 25 n=1 Tax=Davidia involucrata TaxID=16924 RepID=A0A5B7BL58_DAVIN